jgi:hypothetical protein
MSHDLERWAKRYGVPFQRNPFPFLGNTLRLMRGAVASQNLGVFDRYHPAVFSAAWGNALDLGDEAGLQAVLRNAGIDAGELLRSIDDKARKTSFGGRPRSPSSGESSALRHSSSSASSSGAMTGFRRACTARLKSRPSPPSRLGGLWNVLAARPAVLPVSRSPVEPLEHFNAVLALATGSRARAPW